MSWTKAPATAADQLVADLVSHREHGEGHAREIARRLAFRQTLPVGKPAVLAFSSLTTVSDRSAR